MGEMMAYIDKLELFGFFSGYCLLYALVTSLKGNNKSGLRQKVGIIVKLLPYGYAIVATLYAGMIFWNTGILWSVSNFHNQFRLPALQVTALLALLFWIPFFSKKPFISLLHSLFFFFLLMVDIFHLSGIPGEQDAIGNDVKVFTDGLLLNFGTLVLVILVRFSFHYFSQTKASGKDF